MHLARTHSVLLIGHSFVWRMERKGEGFQLDRTRSEVDFCGYIQGRPLNLIQQLIDYLPQFHEGFELPDVIIFILGSTDLASKPDESPFGLALQLAAVAKWFLRRGTSRVVFTEVLPRFGAQAFRPCPQFLWQAHIDCYTVHQAEMLFQRRAAAFNATLRCFTRACNQCSFMKLRGLHDGIRNQLEDGLHLSIVGCRKLHAALRRAMIVELCRCESRY